MKLQVEYIPIGDLRPYKNNAKQHPEKQVDQIIKSIRDYGMNDPIAVWKDNEIIEGHGRYLALKKMGYTEVPVIRLDGLTDAQRREYMLVHNQTTLNSGFDIDLLNLELDDLPEFDAPFYDFDFGEPEEPAEIVEDDAPEAPAEPKTKLGDMYQLGNHRLICGDSTDEATIKRLMGGAVADMVFTDPPYGVAIGDKNAMLNTVQKAGLCCENIENDAVSEEELYGILLKAFINVRENCADDAVYYVTSPQGGSLGLMMMMMRDAGLPVRHVLMWRKNSATFSVGRLDYDYQHEPIFYTWTKSHHNYRNGKYRTTIWDFDKPRKCDLHPTMKPVELVVNALMDGTRKGDSVLDVFGGSGTTIIAAEQTGRKCYMCELDPKYVDVIVERWEKLTGKKAVLIND